MLAIKLIMEGFGLGFLLYLVCAIGIRNGAVGMIHLYEQKVQDRVIQPGMTTEEEIQKRSRRFKGLCIPGYMLYVLVSVYWINGARGFLPGFWQAFVILSFMNLIDRVLIDGYWVGHTDAWIIPGTEDLKHTLDILVTVQFELYRQILKNGYSETEARRCMELLMKFMNAGWTSLADELMKERRN
ncbi:MAG: hypothetical protein IJV59_02030 [Eubacterium sp.]|nr:hypothetical protein [Eubacterium sp.]